MSALDMVIRDLRSRAESAEGQVELWERSARESREEVARYTNLADELADVMPRAEHDRIVETLRAKAEPLARPLDEWHEDIGPVLWWRFPIQEPPYCGTPNDVGQTVEMRHYVGGQGEVKTTRTDVGGWPGYHTHWTPLLMPEAPK